MLSRPKMKNKLHFTHRSRSLPSQTYYECCNERHCIKGENKLDVCGVWLCGSANERTFLEIFNFVLTNSPKFRSCVRFRKTRKSKLAARCMDVLRQSQPSLDYRQPHSVSQLISVTLVFNANLVKPKQRP
jgi:hypothetical protein